MGLEKLIKKCAENNRDAQAEIYQLFASKLFALCLKYSKNYQEAQDNLQDGFVTAFQKIHLYKNKGSFEGWLKRIIINTALQKYRNKPMLSLVHEVQQAPEIAINFEENEWSIDELLCLIQDLPERYRLVFNLYVLDGYTHKEIAEILTISIGTSKSNLSRARDILKTKIEEKKHLTNSKAQS
ncbi:RNA polymerase sigma factor [Urechidicola sp. KH5]